MKWLLLGCLWLGSVAYAAAATHWHLPPYSIVREIAYGLPVWGGQGFRAARSGNQVDLFEVLAGPYDATLIGDSITANGRWSEAFPACRLANRGISGDRVAGVAARLDQIVETQAAVYAVMIGINDLNQDGASTDEIWTAYRSGILDPLSARAPTARILILPILPTARPRVTAMAADINRRLAAYAETRPAVTLLPVWDRFIRGDRLDDALSQDGLHLNGAGYRILWDALAPALASACGREPT